jgi:hypothetical protein
MKLINYNAVLSPSEFEGDMKNSLAVSNFVSVNLIVKLKMMIYEIQKQSSIRRGSKKHGHG